MTQRHEQADAIIAWAEGKPIQFQGPGGVWMDAIQWNPVTHPEYEWRITPEPKPDVVRICWVTEAVGYEEAFKADRPPNLRCTFDGETGKLKSAEVLA